MEFILVRHALPLRVENSDTIADPSLSPIGLEQARRLADWLGCEPINRIVSSPKRRAVETASPLAEVLGLDVEVIQEFSEIDRSSGTYIPVEELRKENHPIYQKMKARQWDDLGYMDPETFWQEVQTAFVRLQENCQEDDTVVVVSHGGTVNAITTHVIELGTMFFFEPAYTSITRLRTNNWTGTLRLATLNETTHLHALRDQLEPLSEAC